MGKQNFLKVIYRKHTPFLIFLIIIQLTTFLLISCEDEVIQPPPKPPGYQEDIPWPSLADSPWPMNHHDPQNTGRTNWTGPKLGQIDVIIDSMALYCSGVFGKDSTIYIAKSKYFTNPCGLYAINSDGAIKWIYKFPDQALISYSTPLIAADGTIYCSIAYPNKFYAINSDGTLKWSIDNINLKMMGINIGIDGTLYFIQSGGLLTAVSKEGNILWTYSDPNLYSGDFSSLSISPDGKTLYLYTIGAQLIAFDLQNQTTKWSFGNYITDVPAVDCMGNLYLIANVDSVYQGNTAIFVLSEEGKIKWSYPLGRAIANLWNSNPIIDKNGNIYCGYDTLYSFDNEGNFRWKKDLCSNCSSDFGFIVSPLVCSVDNIIYATISDVNNRQFKTIKAISSEGNELWSITINEIPLPDGGLSPFFGSDNIIYIPTYGYDSKLLKIK